MNVMINSYCNLQCPYCFAETEMSSCGTNNMTPEAFDKVIDYHKRNNLRAIRIIGGEPTIHPHFQYFLHKIAKDEFFNRVHFFTNMTFSTELREFLILINQDIKVTMLPNFNRENIVGPKYELVKDNIRSLSKYGMIECVGINIFETDFDATYALDLVEECQIPLMRWSITTPNFKIPEDFDVKGYFGSYYDAIINFLKGCHERGIISNLDCNGLPMCAFKPEQVVEMLKYNPLLFDRNSCTPIIDLSPTLDIFRCFGMSDYYSIPLEDDSTVGGLYDKLFEGTKTHYNKLLLEDCKTCPIYEREGGSCSCILYRIER